MDFTKLAVGDVIRGIHTFDSAGKSVASETARRKMVENDTRVHFLQRMK